MSSADQSPSPAAGSEIEARARQQAVVATLGQRALRGTDIPELIQAALAAITETLEVEFVRLFEALPDGSRLRLAAGRGWSEGTVGDTVLDVGGSPTQLGATLTSRQPVIVHDWLAETRFSAPPFVRSHGIRSGITIVVLGRGDGPVFGVLGADSTQARDFSEDDVYFLQGVANVLAGAIAQHRTVAEQQQLLRQVRATEAQFRGLLESAPDAIVTVDSTGMIVLLNSQAERLFGYSREELLGQSIDILLPGPFRDRHAGHRDGYVREPRVRMMGAGLELFAQRKDGAQFPTEISLSPLEKEDGLLVISVIRDITQRKLVEQQLRETAIVLQTQSEELARSNADLQQFAYVASHDLQEPLRMVASFAQLLSRRYRGQLDPDADEFIEFIVDGARRMQLLIEDLLAYSRVNTHGKDLVVTDCGAIVDRLLIDLAPTIQDAQATVTRGELPQVIGDEVQLGQLFQNLIANAIKFRGEEAPEVHIWAEREDEFYRVNIRDNGIGIAPEYRDRIFVIFQRLHTRAEYPGTGIGLAICKKIIERHGGRIWVESGPGHGSTFSFTLPVVRTT